MTPIEAAADWLRLLRVGRFLEAWRQLDGGYRRVLAERWLEGSGDQRVAALDATELDWMVGEVAGLDSDEPDWPAFVELTCGELLAAFPANRDGWGWATDPRPIAVDLALVLFANTAGRVGTEAAVVEAVGVYMRHTPSGWRIAAVNEEPAWSLGVATA